MINEVILKRSIVAVLSAAIFSGTGIAYAFDLCKNMFGKTNNQSKWTDNYRDRFYGYAPMGYGYAPSVYGYAPTGYGYGSSPVHSYPDTSERYESALEILDKRYAMGEIDKQEYEEKKVMITSFR